MDYLINLRSGSGASAPWTDVIDDNLLLSLPASIGSTGWIIGYEASPEFSTSSLGTTAEPTGDAAWVHTPTSPGRVSRSGHGTASTTEWVRLIIQGAPGLDVEIYGNGPSGRVTEVRVNGGPSISYAIGENSTETAKFPGVMADVNGQIIIEYRAATSGVASYLNAIKISDIPVPELTVTGDLQPGASFTVNYANFEGVPASPVTITDSNSNSITVPVTISDNGDGTGTATGTMPDLPSSGSVQGLKFGTVTMELSA